MPFAHLLNQLVVGQGDAVAVDLQKHKLGFGTKKQIQLTEE